MTKCRFSSRMISNLYCWSYSPAHKRNNSKIILKNNKSWYVFKFQILLVVGYFLRIFFFLDWVLKPSTHNVAHTIQIPVLGHLMFFPWLCEQELFKRTDVHACKKFIHIKEIRKRWWCKIFFVFLLLFLCFSGGYSFCIYMYTCTHTHICTYNIYVYMHMPHCIIYMHICIQYIQIHYVYTYMY